MMVHPSCYHAMKENELLMTRRGRATFSKPLRIRAGETLDISEGKAYIVRDGEIIGEADLIYDDGPVDEWFDYAATT